MLPTRSKQTEYAYINRAKLLIEQYENACRVPDDYEFEPKGIARWAIHKRLSIRPATWRQYRSSLIFYFEILRDMGRDDPRGMNDAIRLLKDAGSEVCIRGKGAPSRTSSAKKRSITKNELQQIVNYLDEHQARWSFPTAIFLQASVLAGLRPAEWQTARMQQIPDTDEFTLTLNNAKRSNGRGNGEMRTLQLGAMLPTDHRIIVAHLQIVSNVVSQNRWDLFYRECRNTLYRATRAIWHDRKSYPTLYTGRHQFAANGKMAGLSKPEVAALLGHGSVETAGMHYGKRRSGTVGFTVTPSQENVDRLKKGLAQISKI